MRDTATHVTVRLMYLARLREAFGTPGETLALAHAGEPTVRALLDTLRDRGGRFAEELDGRRAIRIAVNHAVASIDDALRDGDEVALFPPVTGG